MSLSPQCSFYVSIEGGALVPGTKATGTITVEAPEPILRAKELGVVFSTLVSAAFGSGSSRRDVTETLFKGLMSLPIAEGVLSAGVHHFPFALDVPEGLPPAFKGPRCEVTHRLRASVDVGWAFDPTATFAVAVTVPPKTGTRRPLTTRSPDGFHGSIALDVTLASSVVTLDEPISGRIALRAGHEARFDEVEVALISVATLDLGGQDARRVQPIAALSIPRGGAPRRRLRDHPFSARPRHGPGVPVHAPAARSRAPRYGEDPVGPGPELRGASRRPPARLGARRRGRRGDARQRAPAAARGGDGEGDRPPRGTRARAGGGRRRRGHVRLTDAPRGASQGVEIALGFPDLELGIALRPLGLLDGFRRSPLLPRALRDGYLLALDPKPGRPKIEDAALRPLFEAALGDLPNASHLSFSDRQLELRAMLPDDEPARLVDVARRARAIAHAIAEAIARAPFPPELEPAEAAWRGAAEEQGATLVPTGPSLYGVVLRARILGGEERVMTASIRTAWTRGVPSTRVELDLSEAPLPAGAHAELDAERPSDWLRSVRKTFPIARALDAGRAATLEAPAWAADPRALLPALEGFFAFVLHTRGERRTDGAYR